MIVHCLAVAGATASPVMLYDVPHRTGTPFTAVTLTELAWHPNIKAVKDAKGDLFEAVTVMAETGLAYYCGIDELNLPYLAVGASGVVSVVRNVRAGDGDHGDRDVHARAADRGQRGGADRAADRVQPRRR